MDETLKSCPCCGAADTRRGWTELGARDPGPNVIVLANSREYGVVMAYLAGGSYWRSDQIMGPFCDVTHWMPLPEAPKGA